MKKYIDANIIIRFLIGDSTTPENFEYAQRIFREIEEGKYKVILADFILAECIYVLTQVYKIDKKIVVNLLLKIINLKNILIDKSMEDALDLYSQNSLDIADCILIALAKKEKTTILSLDKKLQKIFLKI